MTTQITSEGLTGDLLKLIAGKFYEGDSVGFNKDKKRLLEMVVLWPAVYLDDRGVTLPGDRYKEIFNEVMLQAVRLGNTGRIKYRPAWLAKVIQSHFGIHWEEIYAEAKSARTLALQNLTIVGKLIVAKQPDPIMEMALAAKLVKGTGRSPKRVLKVSLKEQPNLL